MWNRRTLLQHAGIAATSLTAPPFVRVLADQPSAMVLTPEPHAPLPLAADFIGLGYEMSSVATLGLLSVSNAPYLHLVQQLGPAGVLRVGGIVADYTRYVPNGQPLADKHDTVITRAILEQFASFLKRLNWTAIWSVNFAQGTLADAVAEARAVAAVLGPQLEALEIGNEVENYSRGVKPFRTMPYSYESYRAEFESWRTAILAAVPNVRFAGPDTAASVDWVERMAQDSRGQVQLLTTHYYRNNQQRGSAEQLATTDPDLLTKLARLRTASRENKIPWRMCEASSFSGGGRPGVSDTLLGALWTLDFMLLLAANGCSGVNLETGVNQLGFISSYSPIQDDGANHNIAGAPYYGMLAFSTARRGCTHIHALAPFSNNASVTAYALGSASRIDSVVAINRGTSEKSLALDGLGFGQGKVLRLAGPSADSKTGITFAGAAVDGAGRWEASHTASLHTSSVRVPGMSAVVLRRS